MKINRVGSDGRSILPRKRGNNFLTESPPMQSNMEEGNILWYVDVWIRGAY